MSTFLNFFSTFLRRSTVPADLQSSSMSLPIPNNTTGTTGEEPDKASAGQKSNAKKVLKLHTRYVPNVEKLAKDVQMAVGEGTVEIEMRHSVYIIKLSTEIEMKDLLRIITSPQRSQSFPNLPFLAEEGDLSHVQTTSREGPGLLKRSNTFSHMPTVETTSPVSTAAEIGNPLAAEIHGVSGRAG